MRTQAQGQGRPVAEVWHLPPVGSKAPVGAGAPPETEALVWPQTAQAWGQHSVGAPQAVEAQAARAWEQQFVGVQRALEAQRPVWRSPAQQAVGAQRRVWQ